MRLGTPRHRALKQAASIEGRSMTSVVKQAVDEWLEARGHPRELEPRDHPHLDGMTYEEENRWLASGR